MSLVLKRSCIDPLHEQLSVRRQCELIGLNRSSYYYRPVVVDNEEQQLMNLIDEQYTKTPFYGSRRISAWLKSQGYQVNRKRVSRLMHQMGLKAIYPEKKTGGKGRAHRIYPYLLNDIEVAYPDHVWSTDITYVRLQKGLMYLTAVIDWHSRYVLSWELSNTMDTEFCMIALERALKYGTPEIFNTDQGVQFTSLQYTERLLKENIRISMDGKGRALDNIFIERFWRALKYEDIYQKAYESVPELYRGISQYIVFYNHERLHQSLDYSPPAGRYYQK